MILNIQELITGPRQKTFLFFHSIFKILWYNNYIFFQNNLFNQ